MEQVSDFVAPQKRARVVLNDLRREQDTRTFLQGSYRCTTAEEWGFLWEDVVPCYEGTIVEWAIVPTADPNVFGFRIYHNELDDEE